MYSHFCNFCNHINSNRCSRAVMHLRVLGRKIDTQDFFLQITLTTLHVNVFILIAVVLVWQVYLEWCNVSFNNQCPLRICCSNLQCCKACILAFTHIHSFTTNSLCKKILSTKHFIHVLLILQF